MASTLSMGALKCTAHLLPLLYLLRFIINAHNKCVMLALIVINENDNPMFIFWLISYPCLYSCLWDEIRTKLFVASCFVFSAFIANWRLVRRAPRVQLGCLLHVSLSQFSRAQSSIYSTFFLSFSSLSIFASFFPSSWHFNCFGASLIPFSLFGKSFVFLSLFSFFNGRLFCG